MKLHFINNKLLTTTLQFFHKQYLVDHNYDITHTLLDVSTTDILNLITISRNIQQLDNEISSLVNNLKYLKFKNFHPYISTKDDKLIISLLNFRNSIPTQIDLSRFFTRISDTEYQFTLSTYPITETDTIFSYLVDTLTIYDKQITRDVIKVKSIHSLSNLEHSFHSSNITIKSTVTNIHISDTGFDSTITITTSKDINKDLIHNILKKTKYRYTTLGSYTTIDFNQTNYQDLPNIITNIFSNIRLHYQDITDIPYDNLTSNSKYLSKIKESHTSLTLIFTIPDSDIPFNLLITHPQVESISQDFTDLTIEIPKDPDTLKDTISTIDAKIQSIVDNLNTLEV